MKLFAAFIVTFVSITAHAGTGDSKDLAAKAQVSDKCGAKILSETIRECNADSKKREQGNREHECFYNYDLSGKSEGVMNVCFTTGDSDEWCYSVSVYDEEDQNSCDYTVKPQY